MVCGANDSTASDARPRRRAAPSVRCGGRTAAAKIAAATTMPQTNGDASRKASAENATIPGCCRGCPAGRPRGTRSARTTRRPLRDRRHRPGTTRTKTSDSESHFGSAGHPNAPTNWRRRHAAPLDGEDGEEQDERRERKGRSRNRSPRARARRNPTPTPRKLASRTKFVKKDEVDDVRAAPTDQPELDEEHQEAQEEQSGGRRRVREGAGLRSLTLELDHREADASSGSRARIRDGRCAETDRGNTSQMAKARGLL